MTKRIEQDRIENNDIFYIDYGRITEIDDGLRIFYDQDDWFKTLIILRKAGAHLHCVGKNRMTCRYPKRHPHDFQRS